MHLAATPEIEVRRLRDAQRVGHVGSFEWNPDADVVVWSDELRALIGLGDGDDRFDAWLARVHPDDRPHVRARLERGLREGGRFEIEHRCLRPDGETRRVRVNAELLRADDGALRLVGCCWDVTETTSTLDHLRRAVDVLQATLDASADGLLVVDRDRRVVGMNRRFRELWRIPDELARSGDDERLLAYVRDQLDDPGAFMDGVAELYAEPAREHDDVLAFRDGRVFERYSTPQRVDGEIVGRVWSFRDVTERAVALARLEFMSEASRLLASLDAESALAAVADVAVPRVAAEAAVDLREGDGFRRHAHARCDPSQPSCAALHADVAAGAPSLYARDGRSCVGVPLVVQGEVAGALTFVALQGRAYSDTDRAYAEDLARRAALSLDNARLYRGAQEALRARERFLSIAAHEIRGPITAIQLAAQSLARANVDEGAARRLAIVERESRRLGRFVEELLDVGRIRSGQLGIVLEQIDLRDVVADVVARLRPDAERAGSTLTVEADGPAVGRWDRFRLDQIATNLLSNAIKFGRGRPVAVRVRVDGRDAELVVEDHGIGIPDEMRERVFLPFERLVSVRHYGGLGLGLHIVRVLVDAHGGDVRVEPTEGGGTTFIVRLPTERAS